MDYSNSVLNFGDVCMKITRLTTSIIEIYAKVKINFYHVYRKCFIQKLCIASLCVEKFY